MVETIYLILSSMIHMLFNALKRTVRFTRSLVYLFCFGLVLDESLALGKPVTS